ncbi:hypothetical protein [Streptosporangium roseum]
MRLVHEQVDEAVTVRLKRPLRRVDGEGVRDGEHAVPVSFGDPGVQHR